jgi:hypothetical protein
VLSLILIAPTIKIRWGSALGLGERGSLPQSRGHSLTRVSRMAFARAIRSSMAPPCRRTAGPDAAGRRPQPRT